MPCPYCGEIGYVPDYVAANIEAYGSKMVRFPCKKCHQIVKARGIRQVSIEYPEKTIEESDW